MTHRVLLSWAGIVVLCFTACSSKQPPAGPANEPARRAAAESKTPAAPFKDEPAAHAFYNQMIEAIRKAKSLSYTSHLQWQGQNRGWHGECTYRAWLKKPNYFRIETEVAPEKKDAVPEKGGILIGDGDTLWTYWPQGRLRYPFDDPKEFEKRRLTSYMKKPAPLAMHSIAHSIRSLVSGMSWTVLDPSTFHGYTDSLQPYLDGVKGLGTGKVETEYCDKIEVSFMKGNHNWYLWLSRRDHLPRKLRDVWHVSPEIVVNEQWSSVTVNGDLADTMFAWKPPAGWTEYKFPPIEAGLLKPGTKAPDFNLASADGDKIRLSDRRGQIVWLYFWSAG